MNFNNVFFFQIYVTWKESERQSTESIKFQFSESLRRTQQNLAKCTLCCFGGSESDKPEDRYAQEMLSTEIENLKKTIKEVSKLRDAIYYFLILVCIDIRVRTLSHN